MTALTLDTAQSALRIHTFAEGLLARLAHDLELRCGGLQGTAEPGGRTAKLEASIREIEVRGVLKRGDVDAGALSAKDREDIAAKMRREVFHAESGTIRVEVTMDGARARLHLTLPSGRTVDLETRPALDEKDARVHARGTLELSLAALGSDVIKGPMNAFRMKDRVEVHYDVVFG